MDTVTDWGRFAARRAKAPPLIFVNGLRHILKPGVCCDFHSHDAIEIVYHPTGQGVTRLEKNRAVTFQEGDAVIYAPGEQHDQVMETPGEDLCLRIGLPKGIGAMPRRCFRVSGIRDASVIEDIRLLSRGRVRLSPAEQAIFNLRATSTLFALIHLASLHQGKKEDRDPERYVHEAEKYLQDHFATIQSLREASEAAGIGYDHLRHLFREHRGRSMVSYLTEVRLERAKTLLVHSRVPLKQVATLCGFRDEYYFSAVFRRFVRMPPGRYRGEKS